MYYISTESSKRRLWYYTVAVLSDNHKNTKCHREFVQWSIRPANSPDLNPVNYQIWGEAAAVRLSQPDSWRWPAEVTPDRRVGTFPPGVHWWSNQAVVSKSSSLHLSTGKTFWTQTLVTFHICTDVHFDSHMSVRLPIVDIFVLGDLTKPAIAIAQC